MKLIYEIQRSAVLFRVSLLYGAAHQIEVHVATRHLTEEHAVTVDELTAFGVDPIRVALGVAATSTYPVPFATSRSPSLDLSIDVPDPGRPVYRVTVRNNSHRAVRAFSWKSYECEEPMLSGRHKGPLDTPILEPGGNVSFTVSTGPERPPLDLFEIAGVLWEDGLTEGDGELAALEQAFAHGASRQLLRVLALLRPELEERTQQRLPTYASLRNAVETLDIAAAADDVVHVRSRIDPNTPFSDDTIGQLVQIGRRQVRDAILDELTEGSAVSTGVPGVRLWITSAISRYEEWLGRLGLLSERAR